MDTLTFLDPEEAELVAGDTQGDDYRFDFTVPSQRHTQTQQQQLERDRRRRRSEEEGENGEEELDDEDGFGQGRVASEVRRGRRGGN